MYAIKIEVHDNIARVTQKPQRLTSGTIGLPVEFTFDEQWAQLNKVAVFQAGWLVKTKRMDGTTVAVPWEVMERPNTWLSVGVYGINKEGTVAIPTVWANVAPILPGASPCADPTLDPSLPVWQELINDNEIIHKKLDELNELKGEPGEKGEAGYTPEKGVDYFTEEDIATLKEHYIPVGEQDFGADNTVGLKGYYFTAIDFENKVITLSLKQEEEYIEGMDLQWEPGDVLTIINGEDYRNCCRIKSINGNELTVELVKVDNYGSVTVDDKWLFTDIKPVTNYYSKAVVCPGKPLFGQVDFGRNSVVFGRGNKVHNRESVVAGAMNEMYPSGGYSAAFGKENVVKGTSAFARNYKNRALGDNSTAGGDSTEASGKNAESGGTRTKATGNNATAHGENTEASGINATSHGANSKATKRNADAGGASTLADGVASFTRGSSTKASGESAAAFGYLTQATAGNSFVTGSGTIASGYSQTVVGKYNKNDEGDKNSLFVVGVGEGSSDLSRKTGFRVKKNGDADFCGHNLLNFGGGAAVDGKTLTPGTALKTATQSGMYRIGTDHPDMPEGAQNGQLLVIHGAGDTMAQVLFDHMKTRVWVRSGTTDEAMADYFGKKERWKELTATPTYVANAGHATNADNATTAGTANYANTAGATSKVNATRLAVTATNDAYVVNGVAGVLSVILTLVCEGNLRYSLYLDMGSLAEGATFKYLIPAGNLSTTTVEASVANGNLIVTTPSTIGVSFATAY